MLPDVINSDQICSKFLWSPLLTGTATFQTCDVVPAGLKIFKNI